MAGRIAGTGWRILDADIVKDLILRHELRQGTYRPHLAHLLPDGHPLLPRELAALVHHESVQIITGIRHRCLGAGENIVIDGTLAWPPYALELLTELAAHDYQHVSIVDVEVAAALPSSAPPTAGGRVGSPGSPAPTL